MTTIHILGILTTLELIFTKQDFRGLTFILWLSYGIYKLAIIGYWD